MTSSFGFDDAKKNGAEGRAIHLYPGELLDTFDQVAKMVEQEASENGFKLDSVVRTPKIEDVGYDSSCLSWGPRGIIDEEIAEYRFRKQ